MPAHINYETTPIIFYKFVCEDPEIKSCYVGHTTNFMNRRRQHKYCYNGNHCKEHNYKIYTTIRENGGWNNWTMIEIDRKICLDNSDTCKIEQKYIEELQANMNTHFAFRKQTQYNLDNIEEITKRRVQQFKCECGGKYLYPHKTRHFKSLKHLKYCETNLPLSIDENEDSLCMTEDQLE
jgi:hypothetical protein